MSTRFKLILITLLFLGFNACNRSTNVLRELHYVDLLNPENQAFHKYPNEFSTFLLQGVLNEDLAAFNIDYDSSGQIARLEMNQFVDRVLEPFHDYTPGESTVADQYTLEDVNEFLSSVTLIGLDHVSSSSQGIIKYLNFYYPGDLTLTGLDQYICSIDYESALEYIESASSPFIWHNYKLKDWGWFKGRIFHSDFQTSSTMAVDVLKMTDSITLSNKLPDNLTIDSIEHFIDEHPFSLNSKVDISGEGDFRISYKNDTVFYEIAKFTLDEIMELANTRSLEDSVVIIPVTSALLENRMTKTEKSIPISQNGEFTRPLTGKDPLSSRAPGSQSFTPEYFESSQKFYFRTIERLIQNTTGEMAELPKQLYEGVRSGQITVYQSDTLKTRLLPGEFFDNMILDDQDNIPADTDHLIVYQVIVETIFLQSGQIVSQNPIGIGLFLPGKQVPEGLNRSIGYFKISDIIEYRNSTGSSSINFDSIRGYPLKSWNIEAVPE